MILPGILEQKSTQNDLTIGLISWWSLDESSGTRLDSTINNHDLSEVGTVSSTAALINDGATGWSTSNYLSNLDSVFNFLDTTFYFAVWLYPVSLEEGSKSKIILCKDEGGGGITQYTLFVNSGGINFRVSPDGSNTTTVSTNTPNIGSWNLIESYHDATNDIIAIALNNNLFSTTAFGSGIYDNNTINLAIGNFSVSNDRPLSSNDVVDESACWNRVLSNDERATLWNNGNGTAYSG